MKASSGLWTTYNKLDHCSSIRVCTKDFIKAKFSFSFVILPLIVSSYLDHYQVSHKKTTVSPAGNLADIQKRLDSMVYIALGL